ncbi:DUF896 domain-containing protein [Holzapfeliella sp. JNUCC 80]
MSQNQERIDRINELAKKRKEAGLSEAEEMERKKLHREYLADFRAGFKQQIENMKIIDKDGKEVTSEKAKEAQRRKGLRED